MCHWAMVTADRNEERTGIPGPPSRGWNPFLIVCQIAICLSTLENLLNPPAHVGGSIALPPIGLGSAPGGNCAPESSWAGSADRHVGINALSRLGDQTEVFVARSEAMTS
jgi:hypothetical protein